MTRSPLTGFARAAALALAVVLPAVHVAPVGAQYLVGIPNQPDRPRHHQTTWRCDSGLGHLRRVYAEELAGVSDPSRVWVTPICLGMDRVFRTTGNAGTLRQGIAGNDAMRTALFAADFRPEDVVGIRMTGEDSVILFVHPFHK